MYIFSTFAVKGKDMYKLCMMVNEIYCPYLLLFCAGTGAVYKVHQMDFKQKEKCLSLQAVSLCLLSFSVLDEICTFSQNNMFTNFWLTQCSFLWSTSLWSVFLDVQFCCGQWIVHHKGAAWKQISCFSQLRYYYHYCTFISFGLLLLPQSIAETLCGLFELGLRLNHLQLSIWCTAFPCCRTVLPCCRTLPQIMLFGIALFFAGL